MVLLGDDEASDPRHRLLRGMAEALTELGYAEVTLAEIVRRARVSKRTFYEHFASKEECLLALYAAQSAWLLGRIETAIRSAPPGEARVELGAAAYVEGIGTGVGLVRTMLVEIMHVGPRGLELRRREMGRYAELMLREFAAAGVSPPLTQPLAMGLVGGINELILEAVEEERSDDLGELAASVTALVRTFMRPAPE